MTLIHKNFNKFIEDNFKNKDVILALDTAAYYVGRLTSDLPEKITIYIKSENKSLKGMINSFLIEPIVVTTFKDIEYISDTNGVKYCTEEQIIADILKRDYIQRENLDYSIPSYDLYKIVDTYFFYNTTKKGIYKLKEEFNLSEKYYSILDSYLDCIDGEYEECNYKIYNKEKMLNENISN